MVLFPKPLRIFWTIAGWWFGTCGWFVPSYWECHHPYWRTHILQRGSNHQPDWCLRKNRYVKILCEQKLNHVKPDIVMLRMFKRVFPMFKRLTKTADHQKFGWNINLSHGFKVDWCASLKKQLAAIIHMASWRIPQYPAWLCQQFAIGNGHRNSWFTH